MVISIDTYRVTPTSPIDLSSFDADDHGGIPNKATARALLDVERDRIVDAQQRLYAEGKQSLLICIQAMDTGGKDGAIKSVFKGVNQAGIRVRSFKKPNSVELGHDFLWRYHTHAPRNGYISIFNRSHYEDVLVVRVKNLAPIEIVERRYDHINNFESLLEDDNTRILKFYLHITKAEQKKRLLSRLEDPRKHWKYSSNDLAERAYWEGYMDAFEVALNRCSTETAPWYVIPSNKKWYRDLIMARVIANTLEDMNPQFPPAEEGLEFIEIPD